MRTTGWLFIVLGFGWLMLNCLNPGPTYRAVIVKHHESVPRKQSFSRDDVHRFISETGGDLYQHRPWIAVPSLVMMGGFTLILLQEKRRNSQHRDA